MQNSSMAAACDATFCGDENENYNADSTTGSGLAIAEGGFGQRKINLNDFSIFMKQLQESKDFLRQCAMKPLSNSGGKPLRFGDTLEIWILMES